jgi:ATP-binding cassette subfamily B protein
MEKSEDAKEQAPGMKVGTALWHIVSYTAPYKGRVALVILTLVIDVAFDTAMPLSLKFLIDSAITPRDAEMFAIIITCLVGAFILTACSQVSRDYLYGWLGSKVLGDLREKLYGHLQRMSPGFFSRTNSADLVARFSTDLSAVENAIILGMPAAMLAFRRSSSARRS